MITSGLSFTPASKGSSVTRWEVFFAEALGGLLASVSIKDAAKVNVQDNAVAAAEAIADKAETVAEGKP